MVYPESAPSDWIEQLQQRGVVGAISPLHDKDLNATGEPKKAHWHVIVTYEGPTAQSVVERLTERLNALNRFHWNKFEVLSLFNA